MIAQIRKTALLALGAILASAAIGAAPAMAEFGFEFADVTFNEADATPNIPGGGAPVTQAGSHPYSMVTSFGLNYTENPPGSFVFAVDGGEPRDLVIDQIPGFVGDATVMPQCTSAEFLEDHPTEVFQSNCPVSSAVGTAGTTLQVPFAHVHSAVFNLEPPPGVATRFGMWVFSLPTIIDIRVKQSPPYNLVAEVRNFPQVFPVLGSIFELWGDPTDPAHDSLRGECLEHGFSLTGYPEFVSLGDCPTPRISRPFLTVPTTCDGPLTTTFGIALWTELFTTVQSETHDDSEPPNPQGFTGCGKLGFDPSITAEPTTKAAQSPTGLDFSLNVEDEGLTSPTGLADSQIKKAVVTLPEGFSTNPSVAEGLEVCTEEDLADETLAAKPGEGCPEAAKVGRVEVESPLVSETIRGSLFIAEPYKNEFGSLLALYIVLKSPTLGILVKQAGEVIPDSVTGQLTTVVEDIPQLPFSRFNLHFREGVRSPLASPPACGTYEAKAVLTPWSGGEPITTTSAFEIITGPGGGPCPAGGLPPFKPGLVAGTINNAAGRFSPFNVRLFRSDGEQEFTRFSIKLPPGIAGILAGIPKCSDAAIEAAKAKSAVEEIANPSCPAASEVGRSLAGAGVGPALTYAPGKVYLAGPFEGAPISIAAITAAKVGPFDVGTVVIRQGFKIDPRTAEVFLDPIGSDPIPHIIKGVPVHARDIRAYVDRPNFTFNPTNCERTATASTVLGSGLDFGSDADDNPVVVSTPFQAADCAALEFNPKLNLRLIGGTKRGGHPKFRAHLRMQPGEANIGHARVTLPGSAFLDQSHIRTVCTRVQFKEEQCPAGSVYGYAKAVTPILDAPLEGPVYLRSSEHKLPDLVAALRSQEGIKFELVGRVDSVKGRIRNTFEIVPDAPVSSFTLSMQGGAKGLIINSTDLCKGKRKRALAEFTAQNGKVKDFRPVLQTKCGKARKGKRSKRGTN